MRRLDEPVYRHVRVEPVVLVHQWHHEVDDPFIEPCPHVQTLAQVQFLNRIHPRAYGPASVPAPHRVREARHPFGNDRSVLLHVFRSQIRRTVAVGNCEVQFETVSGVVQDQLPRNRRQMVPYRLLGKVPPPVCDLQRRIDATVAPEPQIGPELYPLVMRAVDENAQRVESPVHQALHCVPCVPRDGVGERLLVRPEHHADLRRVEGPVPPFDAVAERVHSRPRHLVDRPPCVPHPNRRVIQPEVIVPCVVMVDRTSSSHIPHTPSKV